MQLEKIRFSSSRGDQLAGRLSWPDAPPRASAVFAHCFTCGKDSRAAARIASALAAQGIATLRFDFAGLGESEGEFAAGFSADVAELVDAVAALRDRLGGPLLLIGHSLGGTAALAAAAAIGDLAGVITIGAPFAPAHVLHQIGNSVGEIERDGAADVTLGGRPFRVTRQFLNDVREHDQAARLARSSVPVLLLHAPDDATVAVSEARRIYNALPGRRSFVSLDGADHLLTGPGDAEYVAGLIAAWATRFLPAPTVKAETPSAADGDVTVTETGAGRFQQRVSAGGTTFLADEPVALGGLGSGPTPYELLAASLGACTAMTLRLYAERKAWPLDAIRTTVRHARLHAADCAGCETAASRIDEFTVSLDLAGALSVEQRARLLEIAGMCPVHRTLASHPKIVIEAQDSRQT